MLSGCLALFGCPSPSVAQQFQSLDSIRKAAADYALAVAKQTLPSARLQVRASMLDSRLRLPRCDGPLKPSAPSGGRQVGHTVVAVRCTGAHPWKLYVPVEVKARLKVLVAAQPLARGAQVDAGMLSTAQRDVAQLPYGYFTRRSAVLGQVLRR
ncbi:MAG: SAF domain-containing protein, partial [Acidihalobacter sp.]